MTITPNSLVMRTIISSLGYVTPKVRAITAGLRLEDHIILRVYYDGVISEDDEENVSCMETELWAAYDPADGIDSKAVRWDSPQPIEWTDMLVYHRYEPDFRLEREPFPLVKLDSKKFKAPTWPDRRAAWIISIRAMLGNVFPELRRAYLYADQMPLKLIFYPDGEVSSKAMHLIAQVQAFIASQIDEGSRLDLVDLRIERCDYPLRIPEQDDWVCSLYSRYDPVPPGWKPGDP